MNKVVGKLVPELRFEEFSGDWDKEKVSKLCDFIVPGRNKPIDFDGDIPWITTPDFVNSNTIEKSKSGFSISKEEAKRIGSRIVPKSSVIISCVGELGLVAINKNSVVLNQQLHAFLPKAKINNVFLLYSLSLQKKFMERVATKTTLLYMNKDNCNSIPIKYPIKKEQQKIANFLTAVDQRISLLKQKKAALETYKKGLMQKIFSQEIRFKGENGADFSDWEEKRLGEVLTIGSGRDYKHLSKGEIPVYGTGGYMTSVNEYLYEGDSAGIGRKGTIDKPVFLTGRFWTVDTLFYTHSFNKVKPYFVYLIFQTINWKKYNEASGVPSLSKSTIEKIKADIPKSLEEQQKIADCLSSMDQSINKLKNQIEQTTQFKKGLIQKMFV